MIPNKQDSDEKMTKLIEEFKTMLAAITYQNNTVKSSPTQKDSTKPPGTTTVVPSNRRAPPLKGGQSTKTGGMWTLKHDIGSPIFYELLIKIELKEDTALELKNVYNHTKMCLNAVTSIC